MRKDRIRLISKTANDMPTIYKGDDVYCTYSDDGIPSKAVLSVTKRDLQYYSFNICKDDAVLIFLEGPFIGMSFVISDYSHCTTRPKQTICSLKPKFNVEKLKSILNTSGDQTVA